jgi:uncharacterized membrane protein (UPF0136 family)
VRALADEDHAAVILFLLMIGGTVGIITRNGGMASIVSQIVSRAKSAVSGQVAFRGMGLMVCFDDFSNTLVVVNTARPLTTSSMSVRKCRMPCSQVSWALRWEPFRAVIVFRRCCRSWRDPRFCSSCRASSVVVPIAGGG